MDKITGTKSTRKATPKSNTRRVASRLAIRMARCLAGQKADRQHRAKTIFWPIVLLAAILIGICGIGTGAAQAQGLAAGPSINAWLGKRQTGFSMMPGERTTQVKPEEMYLGLTIPYQVSLENCGNVTPSIAKTDDFTVQAAGQHQTEISTPTIQRITTTYTYLLTPLRTGQLIAPVATVEVAGQTLTGPELKIDVLRQDRVELQVSTTPSSPVLMQEVTATVSVYIKALPDRYAKQDPMRILQSRTNSRPSLVIPWLDDENVPASLVPILTATEWREENVNLRKTGFHLNDWVHQRAMAGGIGILGPMVNTPVCISVQPSLVFRTDEDGVQVPYWRYDISRRFIAKQLGNFELPPCRFYGAVPMINGMTGQLQVEEIGAVGLSVKDTVRDVPLAGRPDSYIDAVGQFTIGARLTPQTLRLGEKMTLTLSIRGSGTLSQIRPPAVDKIPGIERNFKIFDPPGDELADDARIFSYDVKPLRTDVTEFPSFSVSYFDPISDSYKTVQTPKFDIKVEENTEVHVPGIGNGNGGPAGMELSDEGIFMESVDPADVGDDRPRVGLWLAGLLGLGVVYGLIAVGTMLIRRQSGNVALRRRRGASGQARTRLVEARRVAGNDPRAAADHVRDAIVGLIGDMLNLPPDAMTPGDAQRRLRQCGADQKTIDETRRILEACDGARYGATDTAVSSLVRDAQTLLVPLTKQLRGGNGGTK